MQSDKNQTKVLIVDDLAENLLALRKVLEQDDRTIYHVSLHTVSRRRK